MTNEGTPTGWEVLQSRQSNSLPMYVVWLGTCLNEYSGTMWTTWLRSACLPRYLRRILSWYELCSQELITSVFSRTLPSEVGNQHSKRSSGCVYSISVPSFEPPFLAQFLMYYVSCFYVSPDFVHSSCLVRTKFIRTTRLNNGQKIRAS